LKRKKQLKGEIMIKHLSQTHYLLFALLLGVFLTGICSPASAQTGGTMKIKLYFPKEDPDADNELVVVERNIKRTNRVADAALRELLKGVTEDERKKGLSSSFSVDSVVVGRDECAHEKLKPLGEYLIGVSIKKGVATVNFRHQAECYLQTTAFMQARTMNPIDATLKQFKTIKEVQYALNGKVITEWDA
jgi:spore germination protein GerM